MECFKDWSDRIIIWLLRATSGFGKELTADGRREQAHWRDLRLKNLQALALRAKQRYRDKEISA